MKDLPQKSGHINAIDGLRGVAAFAVLAHHSRNAILDFHFGYLAVDFFFVLSGYVIGLAYEQRLERGLRVSDYIITRLERLYPMLLIGALFGLIAVQVTPADGYFIPKESYGLSIAFLAQVLLIPFVISQSAFFINGPQWSIVFEILVNIFHAVFRRQLSNLVLIFILGLSAAALVRIGITHGNINYGWGADNFLLGVPRVLFGFFAGLLLQRTQGRWANWLPTVPFWLLCIVLLMLLGFPQWSIAPWATCGFEFANVFVIFPLITALAANSTSGGLFGRSLGVLSYPLYSIHQPLLYLAVYFMKVANVGDGPLGILPQVISTFLILGLAYAIGRFIDVPWNRWRKKARQTVSKNSSDSTMGFGVSAKAIHPNFLVIKTIAALCVALSASILIATKSDVNDPLRSTNLTIGVYGLFVLAISSGYLTAEGAWRQNDVRNFLIKRFWRIAPAFVVSTLVIVYVICPFFAQGGKLAFVKDPTVLNVVTKIVFFHTDKFYFPNMAFYQTTQSDDFLPGIANAAIWSIRLQVICYAIIAIFMAMSLFRKRAPLVAMLPFVWLAGLSVIFSDTTTVNWLHLLLFVLPAFCCGAFMNGLARYHKLQGWIAGLSSAGLLVAAYWGLLPDVFCFLAAYPIAWLGIHAISPLKKSLAKTDISYGIYLYCWPIAQLTKAGFGSDFGGYEMATIVLPLATAMGWLSWHLVESPALGWGLAQTSPASDEEKKFVPPLGTTKRWIGPDKENR